MNNDLISRSELKKAIDKLFESGGYDSGLVMNAIDNAPTVEPKKEIVPVCKVTFDKEELQRIVDEKVAELVANLERLQGEWITRHKENSFGQDVVCFECNKCGEYKLPIIHTMITEPLGVCPNCGVNMRKGGTE